MTLLLIVSFCVLAALSVPIAFALLISSVITLLAMGGIGGIPMTFVPSNLYSATEDFSLLAIPFFILAGNIMVEGGIAKRLVDFAYTLLGGIAGGLAHGVTLASMFFAALSGSAAATSVAIGKTLVPEMKRHHYDPKFCASVIATSGVLGMIIPPSIAMIVYAMAAEVSVTKLFAGGVIPGILCGLIIMGYSYYIGRKNNYVISEEELRQRPGFFATFRGAFWALTMPVLILGGIYGGFFTPTEASAVAVVYALVVSFIYRELNWKSFFRSVLDSSYDTAIILLMFAASTVLSWVLVSLQIPQALASYMVTISDSPYVIMILILILYLIVGIPIEPSPAIVLLVPILLPVVRALNIDLVFFGVFSVITLGLGLLTPPVGSILFVVSNVTDVVFEDVCKAVIPLVSLLVLFCVVLIFFPQIITFLPDMLGR